MGPVFIDGNVNDELDAALFTKKKTHKTYLSVLQEYHSLQLGLKMYFQQEKQALFSFEELSVKY